MVKDDIKLEGAIEGESVEAFVMRKVAETVIFMMVSFGGVYALFSSVGVY